MKEEERLNALREYAVMDTLPEADYDDLTRIAALICNTPIALITLLDDKKQFFKSRLGLDISETPRNIAFCAHAIRQPDEIMVVPDAREDGRFSGNPLVTGDPGIVFYAGMPLVSPDGYALGTLCVIDRQARTITPAQQEALRSLSRQVINLLELRRLNELLRQSEKRLDLKSREMEGFAHAAAHDLKEPLRMVKSFLKLLNNKYGKDLAAEAKKYIHFAVDGAVRMEQLLEDLLEYASVGAQEDKAEIVNMNTVLEEVKTLLEHSIREKNALIASAQLPNMMCSHTAMRGLLQNLVANALKYQNPGARPEIFINGRELPAHWEISVTDNGIGIPEDQQEVVFAPFKRLHSKETFSGTGLGLAICRKIAGRYQGSIRVESAPGKGSTFYVTISKNNKHETDPSVTGRG